MNNLKNIVYFTITLAATAVPTMSPWGNYYKEIARLMHFEAYFHITLRKLMK